MAEFLKRAVADLESPSCPDCKIQMLWFRSMRMSMKELVITHVFQCPNCSRIEEVKTRNQRKNGSPKKTLHQHPAAA